MHRVNVNRNGFLVLGLCFGLFLASALQCELNERSDLNGYKQESNSDRGPSNSSGSNDGGGYRNSDGSNDGGGYRNSNGSNDGGGYRNSDGSSGGDNDRKKEIEEGIEIVTKALKAMRDRVHEYEELEKRSFRLCRQNFRYYKACGSLFIELNGSLWCPKDPWGHASSWEKLCHYVSRGSSSEILKILGLSVKGNTRRNRYVDRGTGNGARNRLDSLLNDCSKILEQRNGPQKSADDNVKASLNEFREAFAEVYEQLVLPLGSSLLPWEPGNDLNQLVGNLYNIQSGFVKIFGQGFTNFDQDKAVDSWEQESYECCKKFVDFLSSEGGNNLWFSTLAQANYDNMIALTKNSPDYLKKAN